MQTPHQERTAGTAVPVEPVFLTGQNVVGVSVIYYARDYLSFPRLHTDRRQQPVR
jgi:hypothetical protein